MFVPIRKNTKKQEKHDILFLLPDSVSQDFVNVSLHTPILLVLDQTKVADTQETRSKTKHDFRFQSVCQQSG